MENNFRCLLQIHQLVLLKAFDQKFFCFFVLQDKVGYHHFYFEYQHHLLMLKYILKRLLKNNVVTVRNNFSDGGKKSTYYGLAMHWQKKFNDLFFTPLSDNPTNFFTELQSRIAVLSLLEDDLKETFFEDILIKLETLKLDLINTQEDEYITFDEFQKALLKNNINEIENYQQLLNELRNI